VQIFELPQHVAAIDRFPVLTVLLLERLYLQEEVVLQLRLLELQSPDGLADPGTFPSSLLDLRVYQIRLYKAFQIATLNLIIFNALVREFNRRELLLDSVQLAREGFVRRSEILNADQVPNHRPAHLAH